MQCLLRAAELSPDEGHVKFLYLGQLHCGQRAAQYLTTAIDIMRRGREVSGKGEGRGGGRETVVVRRGWRSTHGEADWESEEGGEREGAIERGMDI